MAKIEINTPDGPIDALLGVPDGPGPWPAVVVVHDAIGYGPDNEAISARVAAAGFIAISPNLYSRGGRALHQPGLPRTAHQARPRPRRHHGRP